MKKGQLKPNKRINEERTGKKTTRMWNKKRRERVRERKGMKDIKYDQER